MPIVFEGEPPYETLVASAANSEPTPHGVVLILTVPVEGLLAATVPLRIQIKPAHARALCPLLCTQAGIVEQWQKSGFEG
jgi:hypothetical protein